MNFSIPTYDLRATEILNAVYVDIINNRIIGNMIPSKAGVLFYPQCKKRCGYKLGKANDA